MIFSATMQAVTTPLLSPMLYRDHLIMRTYNYSIWVIAACILGLFAACSKSADAIYPEDGGLGFYNASQVLREDVQGNNKRALILLNSNTPIDTVVGMQQPNFEPAFNGSEVQQFFPRKAINASSPPWMGYIRMRPGIQQVAFLATDSSLVLQTEVTTASDRNSCLYLSDSLGTFYVTNVEDNSAPVPQTAQLQVLQLSPDAGALLVKVNDQPLPQQLAYRNISSIQTYATPDDVTAFPLRIQVSRAEGPDDIISRATINAMPGHSYTLIINGYYYTAAYTDKHSGQQVNILPDFRLSVMRNQ